MLRRGLCSGAMNQAAKVPLVSHLTFFFYLFFLLSWVSSPPSPLARRRAAHSDVRQESRRQSGFKCLMRPFSLGLYASCVRVQTDLGHCLSCTSTHPAGCVGPFHWFDFNLLSPIQPWRGRSSNGGGGGGGGVRRREGGGVGAPRPWGSNKGTSVHPKGQVRRGRAPPRNQTIYVTKYTELVLDAVNQQKAGETMWRLKVFFAVHPSALIGISWFDGTYFSFLSLRFWFLIIVNDLY